MQIDRNLDKTNHGRGTVGRRGQRQEREGNMECIIGRGAKQGQLHCRTHGRRLGVTVPSAGCFGYDGWPSRRTLTLRCRHCQLLHRRHWIQSHCKLLQPLLLFSQMFSSLTHSNVCSTTFGSIQLVFIYFYYCYFLERVFFDSLLHK